MNNSGARSHASPAKRVLFFVMHQLTAALGVPIAAPFLVGFGFDLLRLIGYHFPIRDLHRLVTEIPYFPAQVFLAFFLGWSLGKRLRDKAMQWVWVLPFLILCVGIVAFPAVRSLTFGSRIAHFFGRACQLQDLCFDQLVFTMPFYASASCAIFKKNQTPNTSGAPHETGANT